jgi:hypothetical protein
MDISYCWEALGKYALPPIREKQLMANPNPDIAYAAARAAAFLGDPAAPEALMQMARTAGHKFQINAVQALGSLAASPSINDKLRPLLDAPDTLVRIEAYKMLAKNGDQRILSTRLRTGFTLDIVRSSGPPIIYATRRGEPRIALIGSTAGLKLPIAYLAMDNRLSITSDFNNRSVTIFYRPPMPKAGPRSREQLAAVQAVRVTSRPDIAEIVARLAGEGFDDRVAPGLAFNYGQVLSILSSLTSNQQVTAYASGSRVPASFILQELPQVQDSIYSAPVIPDQGRPQTDDEAAGRRVGMAK